MYASSSQFGLPFYQIISSIKNPNLLLIKSSEMKYETILTVVSVKRYQRLVVDITNFAPWTKKLANKYMIPLVRTLYFVDWPKILALECTPMQLAAITSCLNDNYYHNNQAKSI